MEVDYISRNGRSVVSISVNALVASSYLEGGFRLFLCSCNAGSSDYDESRERYASHGVRRTETRNNKIKGGKKGVRTMDVVKEQTGEAFSLNGFGYVLPRSQFHGLL